MRETKSLGITSGEIMVDGETEAGETEAGETEAAQYLHEIS